MLTGEESSPADAPSDSAWDDEQLLLALRRRDEQAFAAKGGPRSAPGSSAS